MRRNRRGRSRRRYRFAHAGNLLSRAMGSAGPQQTSSVQMNEWRGSYKSLILLKSVSLYNLSCICRPSGEVHRGYWLAPDRLLRTPRSRNQQSGGLHVLAPRPGRLTDCVVVSRGADRASFLMSNPRLLSVTEIAGLRTAIIEPDKIRRFAGRELFARSVTESARFVERSVCPSWAALHGVWRPPRPCMLLKLRLADDSIPSASSREFRSISENEVLRRWRLGISPAWLRLPVTRPFQIFVPL
jgi:hypothetical protein